MPGSLYIMGGPKVGEYLHLEPPLMVLISYPRVANVHLEVLADDDLTFLRSSKQEDTCGRNGSKATGFFHAANYCSPLRALSRRANSSGLAA